MTNEEIVAQRAEARRAIDENRAAQWQARAVRIGALQTKCVAILFTLMLIYAAVVASDWDAPRPKIATTSASGRDRADYIDFFGIRVGRPFFYTVGPAAIWLSLAAFYGSTRMATTGKFRLTALGRYVPSSFMDVPNFFDATIYTTRWPADSKAECMVGKLGYPVAVCAAWLGGVAVLAFGLCREFITAPAWACVVLYGYPFLAASRGAWRFCCRRFKARKRSEVSARLRTKKDA